MKNDLVCQLNSGHKIWGAVAVMMEGMYPDIFQSAEWCTVYVNIS